MYTKKHGGHDLPADLARALGSTVVLRALAQGYHWNVTGPDFYQYHEFFAEVYEDAESAVDPMAENLRKLGYQAPTTLHEFLSLSSVTPRETSTSDGLELSAALYAANNVVLEDVRRAFDSADACGEQGVADFLAGRIDMHDKWRWQLGATIGADPASERDVPRATVVTVDADVPLFEDETAYPAFDGPEDAIGFLASAHSVSPISLRAAWRRAVQSAENSPFDRARELAVRKYDSRDADLLPLKQEGR
jgi:starvation-inducible DNA-binding protein